MCLIALACAPEMHASDEQLMCVERPGLSAAVESLAEGSDVVLFATADSVRRELRVLSLRLDPLQDESTTSGNGVRYSIAENMTAAMSYNRAVVFERGSTDELRTSRFSSLSTARDRDVLGLGMDWGLGDNNSVGFGYQLQSIRPDSAPVTQSGGGGTSILPRSEGLDHAFTFGVTRSWGGDD